MTPAPAEAAKNISIAAVRINNSNSLPCIKGGEFCPAKLTDIKNSEGSD